MPKLLTPKQIDLALEDLPDWDFEDDSVVKAFEFKDFDQAWAFMSKVAAAAANANHHPEWTNVYNEVLIRLRTHDQGGVTQQDIDLAKAVEAALSQ